MMTERERCTSITGARFAWPAFFGHQLLGIGWHSYVLCIIYLHRVRWEPRSMGLDQPIRASSVSGQYPPKIEFDCKARSTKQSRSNLPYLFLFRRATYRAQVFDLLVGRKQSSIREPLSGCCASQVRSLVSKPNGKRHSVPSSTSTKIPLDSPGAFKKGCSSNARYYHYFYQYSAL